MIIYHDCSVLHQVKDVPGAISEVLQTRKGTTFYVITVAGEYGIPADTGPASPRQPDASPRSPRGAGGAFMTEVSGLSGERDSRPEFLRNVDVPEMLLNDIKKM